MDEDLREKYVKFYNLDIALIRLEKYFVIIVLKYSQRSSNIR